MNVLPTDSLHRWSRTENAQRPTEISVSGFRVYPTLRLAKGSVTCSGTSFFYFLYVYHTTLPYDGPTPLRPQTVFGKWYHFWWVVSSLVGGVIRGK